MKSHNKSQGKRQFIIKCIASNGRYAIDYRIYNMISLKLALGYEVVLRPESKVNVIQGRMYNIIIEESL